MLWLYIPSSSIYTGHGNFVSSKCHVRNPISGWPLHGKKRIRLTSDLCWYNHIMLYAELWLLKLGHVLSQIFHQNVVIIGPLSKIRNVFTTNDWKIAKIGGFYLWGWIMFMQTICLHLELQVHSFNVLSAPLGPRYCQPLKYMKVWILTSKAGEGVGLLKIL